MSKVIIVRTKNISKSNKEINSEKLNNLYKRGFHLLTGFKDSKNSIKTLLSTDKKTGIKINTIGGRSLSTRPKVSLFLADYLIKGGFQEKDILIWDRTNRELRSAGYRLNMNQGGIKIFGTDSNTIGYDKDLTVHRSIGSRFSSIQSDIISQSISLAILKDHGLAGITAGMKNYFGSIHNPNKYHDYNCNPFVADLFDTAAIRGKHKLTVIDALTVQFHKGPAYHSLWTENYGGLIMSTDPVAADYIGWQVIEELRKKHGLPSLKEENREPLYIKTAEELGLGSADPANISIIKEEI
ncbi:MAG TPA: DUF362 domain-containing protein [Candidatus Aminicenantes bacterium]|nr:DUF362 domain-containing protein [Candidatus Aminicenantes bacterium]